MTTTTPGRPLDRPQPVRDSLTMLRRNLRHLRAYPSLTIMLLAQPIIFLLLFVYVFGGSMGAGLPGGGDRGDYLAFVTPAILVIAVTSVSLGTAISVATDTTGGLVKRFRTMPIARSSLLTGHVLGAMIQSALAVVVSLALAVVLGFRTDAGPVGWAQAVLVLVAIAAALTWLTVALGLAADSVETASNTPTVLVLLPLVGSGFTPTEQMPTGLRWFAEHQPFTPVMDAVRGALLDGGAGADLWWALGWCVVIGVAGYAWSRRLFARELDR